MTVIGTEIAWENPDKTYVDFRLHGISGVFRAADASGVDLSWVVDSAEKNRYFFRRMCYVENLIFDELTVSTNWGGGWEWQELGHPLLAKGFCVDTASIWHTCPVPVFGGAPSMEQLHPVRIRGVKLMQAFASQQPSFICYFFPDK